MNHPNRTIEELLKELQELKQENASLKASYSKSVMERELAEESYRSIELKYHELVENSPDAIAIYEDGKIVFVNNECLRLMAVTSSTELLGVPVMQFIHPDYRTMVVERVKHAMTHGNVLPLAEEIFLRPDGSEVQVEVKAMPIQFENKPAMLSIVRDISKRKEAEEKLQNEHLLLRTIIDNIPDSIYTKDLSFRKTLANSTELRYMGAKSEAEILGKDDFDIYPKELAQRFQDDDRTVIQTGIPIINREEYVFDINQQKRWLVSSKLPLRDKDNQVIGLVGIGHDITNQKHTEQALRESEEKYRAVAENSFEGILIIDFEGKILYANQSLIRTFEYEHQDEIIGENVFRFICEESIPKAIEDLTKVAQGAILEVSEYFGITRKGRKILFESMGKIVEYQGVTADIITVRDITARKQAEEALQESEMFLNETQHIARLGTYTLDIASGNWTSSDILNEIFGIEPHFEKSVKTWVGIIHPEWQGIMNDYFIHEVLKKKSKFDKEYKIVRQNDREERWVHGIGRLKLDENNRIVSMVGTIRDITIQKLIEKELQEQNEEYAYLNQEYINQNLNLIAAKEKAEENTRLKSAFLANMSHEIRTPMNGILGFAEILKEPNLTSDQQQEYIEIIEKSGVRMLNIINDIVDISKIESGQMKVSLSETSVNEQLLFIYNFFKSEVETKGLKLTLKNFLPSSEVLIRTDREKLYAILTNLVKNAVKYTKEGSIEFGCGSTSSPNAAVSEPVELEFYVRDTGIGIPKDRQEAIFERFIQADVSDKMALQGAGLGLAITKAYVGMLGGRIWVESEERNLSDGKSGGSIFYFTLPCQIEEAEVEVSGLEISEHNKEIQIRNLKILIAEDDEGSASLISIVVRKFGKEILKVRTGLEAVETCRENPDIDLILMDIQMPEMDGYEATREIRRFNEKVVIIAQTAYALSGDQEKAIAAGCTDYISKPIKNSELLRMMQNHFQN
ncbi:MAG: PAS domain S-box protein [Bacteroidia bacterium]